MLIDTKDKLTDFIARAQESEYLAIDTEFLREKTYYAKLCLVQIATDKEIAIIDPLALKTIKPLAVLLENGQIVKIFHACKQDVEILLHETGVVAKPIFDTQIAASLLGKMQQASYRSLVQQYCGEVLPKTDSFTDWSRRPLSDSQLKYAADDVYYLPEIYKKMVKILSSEKRLHWLDETFANLSDRRRYEIDPYDRYLKLRRVGQLNPRQLAAAKEFAAWREKRAQQLNIPRKWVVSDEQIVEACRREARTLPELYMVRGMRDALKPEVARKALESIRGGLDCPEEDLPKVNDSSTNEANVDVITDLMSAIAKLRSNEYHIALQTLAPHDELKKLARGYDDDCEILKGWRYKLLGKELLEFLNGDFALRISNKDLEIVRESDRDK